jgi:stage II sporulation protein D
MQTPMIRRLPLAIATFVAFALSAGPAGASTLFTLTGHGWGHGIGMSQYGALGYAQHGWDHQRILTHYYTGTTIGLLARGTTERVLLIDGRSSIHLSFTSAATATDDAGTSRSLPAGAYRVDLGTTAGKVRLWSATAGRYVWQGIDTAVRISPGSTPLQLRDTAINGYSDDHWWGDFRVARAGGSLSLVDYVPMEKYVRGVVPCEVPASWLPEAVEAQAVAARSYAAATRRGGSFDAYPDTRSQMYCPIERQAAASDAAVAATKRQIVKYAGHVATTYFSSSSGGRTSSLSASWGSGDLPYLMPVRDHYDGAGGLNPNHTWSPKLYTPSNLAAQLGLSGNVSSLDQTIDDPSRRVLSVLVHHDGAATPMSAGDVFSRLGLRSTYFRILQVTLAAPANVGAGQTFQLHGRLWPKPTAAFTLQARFGAEGAWKAVTAPVALDADGRFSISRSPGKDVRYRLVRNSAFSPVLYVHVHPLLTLASGGGFHGSMTPAVQGATVILQRDTSGGWVDVESATVAAGGGYQFAQAVASGSWRARFHRDADHSDASSDTLVIP